MVDHWKWVLTEWPPEATVRGGCQWVTVVWVEVAEEWVVGEAEVEGVVEVEAEVEVEVISTTPAVSLVGASIVITTTSLGTTHIAIMKNIIHLRSTITILTIPLIV